MRFKSLMHDLIYDLIHDLIHDRRNIMTHSDILKKPSDNKGNGTLGLGCMRFPSSLNEVIDMTDAYLEAGFNYFDTAYVYGGSEDTLNKALVKRHPRDSYLIADKIPPWSVSDHKSCDKIFGTVLI